jgi:hypothetical protein
VRKRLAGLEGEQGRTIYAGGVARIELPEETLVVRPPFGLAYEAHYDTVYLTPLFAALDTVWGAQIRARCKSARSRRRTGFAPHALQADAEQDPDLRASLAAESIGARLEASEDIPERWPQAGMLDLPPAASSASAGRSESRPRPLGTSAPATPRSEPSTFATPSAPT